MNMSLSSITGIYLWFQWQLYYIIYIICLYTDLMIINYQWVYIFLNINIVLSFLLKKKQYSCFLRDRFLLPVLKTLALPSFFTIIAKGHPRKQPLPTEPTEPKEPAWAGQPWCVFDNRGVFSQSTVRYGRQYL